MKKRQVLNARDFRPTTAMTVVAHAIVRAKKGKRPSMAYCGISNPREAYQKAVNLICDAKEMFHISDLVALYFETNISLRGMDAIYEGIHFLNGKRPFTNELTYDLFGRVRDHLNSELPFLKEIEVPELRCIQDAREWAQFLEQKYGAYHEVSKMEKDRNWIAI